MSRFVKRLEALAPLIAAPPPPQLAVVVVIPCCDEPDLGATLRSLLACPLPPGDTAEIIVVVNEASTAAPSVAAQNLRTMEELGQWARNLARAGSPWRLHAAHLAALPPKAAGVGVARRAGMDEAARRLFACGHREAPILSLDADTLVEPSYVRAVRAHVAAAPACDAVSIYFEHPVSGVLSGATYAAAVQYELHLRYWIAALRWAGCPWAFQTIGSAFAVRARAYVEQGGMSDRQAGEDFYFLHKFSVRGTLQDLTTTTVYPASRTSARTPFGTGPAVAAALAGQAQTTYAWATVREIAGFLACLPDLPGDQAAWLALGGHITPWLRAQRFDELVRQAAAQTASAANMVRRLLQWFTPFRAMKFAHAARDAGAANVPPDEAARALLLAMGHAPAATSLALLTQLRSLAKAPAAS